MTIVRKAKGPATAPTVPSHGSIERKTDVNTRTISTTADEYPPLPMFPTSIDAEIAAVSTLSGLLAEAVEDAELYDEQRHYVLIRLSGVDHARLCWLANELAVRSGRLEEIWLEERVQ